MVYFVQAVDGGPIKIGHTQHVEGRHLGLEGTYSRPLALLGVVEGGRQEERAIHERFSHLRIGRTEQFQPANDLLAFIGVALNEDEPPIYDAMPTREHQEPGFRTVGFRASNEYVDWLTGMAKLDRLTVAQFIDKAVTERARQLDPTRPPPERIP